MYVHSSIYDKFVEASTKLAAKKVVGDPFDDKTEQGPQVDSDQMHSILNYIKLGKEQGAQLHTGAHMACCNTICTARMQQMTAL